MDCVETPRQSQDQDEVTANTRIGDGRASSSGQNQDQVRVSANVITAKGGDSETPTSSTVHFAKFASYKTCSPTAFTSQKVALQVVPVRVEGENGNSVSTWALLDTGSKESFIAKSTADKLRLRVKNFESLAVCTLTGESTVRVGRVDLTVLSMEGRPEGHRSEIKDVKVVEHLHVNMSRPQDLTKWEHLNDIPPPEIGGEEVTLLIGANVPEAHIHEEVRVGGVGEPYAVRTLFGWAIMGPLNGNITSQFNKANVNFLRYGNETLDQQMSQFIALENIDSISSSRKGM